jgi:hypothetical protein
MNTDLALNLLQRISGFILSINIMRP